LDPLTEIGGQLRRALGLDSYFDGAGLDARRITGGSPISALQPQISTTGAKTHSFDKLVEASLLDATRTHAGMTKIAAQSSL
jgi:hypothetical protein